MRVGRTTTGKSPFLSALFRKMSAMEVGHDGAEAGVDERPGRVLAGAAAAEVVARHEDGGAARLGAVQDEVGRGAPPSS